MSRQPYSVGYVVRLLASYRDLTGHPLLVPLPRESEKALAQRLYAAQFVVLAHDASPDPCFNYANLAAQRLFECGWDDFIALPSRLSAQAPERQERARLLARIITQGYIDDYSGIRVSRTGRRFVINRATVWNVTNASGVRIGQAATFSDWSSVE